jgi:TRAP-type C4-dicarboxylate transport system substrate-binding protein
MRIRSIVALTASLAALSLGSVRPAGAQIVIKLGTIAPEGSIWDDTLLDIRQKWRDLTNGQVELRIYPGGVLGGEDEMVRKMQRRSLDALTISGAGLPFIDDIVSCLNLPLLFDSYDELDKVRREIAPELERSFEMKGYKILNWAEAGWVHFFAKDPVATPDDLRKQRLWTSSGASSEEALLKELGFRVVALPATDMLTGLQTGMIEAIDVPPLFALLDRSYQVADNMTALGFAPLVAATVITTPAWNRIPEQFRDDLVNAARSAAAKLRAGVQKAEQDAIDEMVARGLHLVKLDAQQVAQWHELSRSVYTDLTCAKEYPALFNRIMMLQGESIRAEP